MRDREIFIHLLLFMLTKPLTLVLPGILRKLRRSVAALVGVPEVLGGKALGEVARMLPSD